MPKKPLDLSLNIIYNNYMLRIIGDVHGKFRQYLSRLPEEAESLQLGDLGIGFGEELKPLPIQHKFIRGNHDNPQQCQAHPNYLGEFGFDKCKNLFYLGGAWSIDKEIRLRWEAQGEKKTWWEDEELSPGQLQDAFKIYIDVKPKIVVTHDCPEFMAKRILGRGLGIFGNTLNPTRTGTMLDKMWAAHEPEIWVFGHWHNDLDEKVGNTRFVCLAELSYIDLEI